MRIKTDREQLLQGLNAVQKAISGSSIMPILRGILIRGENNLIYLTANDMQLGIEIAIKGTVLEPGSIVVDGRLFWDIVKRLKDEFIELRLTDKHQIEIKSKELDLSLKAFDSVDFPQLPTIPEANAVFIDEGHLNKMIKQTGFAVSKGEHMQSITGCLLEVLNDEIIMAATDGYRFALARHHCSNTTGMEAKAIIPGSSLIQIGKLLSAEEGRTVKIALQDKYAALCFDNIKIITRLLQGSFISHRSVIPIEFETQIRVNTKDILYSLEITSIFASYSNTGVKLEISDDELLIHSNAGIGSISKRLNIEKKGKDLVIAFNNSYLLEGLRVFDEDEALICFANGSNSPAVIKSVANDAYEYLILPVRLSNNTII